MTQPVMRLERVEVWPVLAAPFSGRLELATLLVRRADLSQAAVDPLAVMQAVKPAGGGSSRPGAKPEPQPLLVVVPRRVVLDAVTGRTRDGAATVLNADALLWPQGLPDKLALTILAGRLRGATARLARRLQIWDLEVEVAGGTVQGQSEMPGKLSQAGLQPRLFVVRSATPS